MLFLYWDYTEAVYLALPNLDYLALPFYVQNEVYVYIFQKYP